MARLWMFLPFLLLLFSCNKVKEYFREPDPEPLLETIHTSALTGYAVNVSFAMMVGHSIEGVNFHRSNAGFPCTTITAINTSINQGLYLANLDVNAITVAGLWTDESTAILSILLTGFDTGTTTLDLLGIKTVPVIRTNDHINIAMASMDI